MRDVHIEHFDEKFSYLFSNHPKIKNYTTLAQALGVAPALVSGWKNGTQYTRPEHIPIRHIGSVCDHLFVSQEVLELDDIQQFKVRAAERPRPSRWDALVLQAPHSPRLRIASAGEAARVQALPLLRIASAGEAAPVPAAPPLLTTRGIFVDDELEPDVPIFKVGEKVLIRFDAEPGWHVALFAKDRVGWQRLHPTPKWPETRTEEGIFYYPQPRDLGRLRLATLDGVAGPQLLAAVMTEGPLPELVREAIIDGTDLPSALQQLAVHLGQAQTPVSELMQLRYHVEP